MDHGTGFLGLSSVVVLCVRRLFAASEADCPSYSSIHACTADQPDPTVTVLLTVYNEQDKIVRRLDNILDTDFPLERLQVIVASDGSTDSTDELVRAYDNPQVCLTRPLERRGKTDTQNQAIASATGDILIFTDADTVFQRSFISNVVKEFEDPQVGGADGRCVISEMTTAGFPTVRYTTGIGKSPYENWKVE